MCAFSPLMSLARPNKDELWLHWSLIDSRRGRWSMLDVFLAGLLSGLVRFGELSNVEPRIGIVAFALAVVLTVRPSRPTR